MKKTYERPAMAAMEMDMSQQILTGSTGSGISVDETGSITDENDFQSRHKNSGWSSDSWYEY